MPVVIYYVQDVHLNAPLVLLPAACQEYQVVMLEVHLIHLPAYQLLPAQVVHQAAQAHLVPAQAEEFQTVQLLVLFQLAVQVEIAVVYLKSQAYVILHYMNALAAAILNFVQPGKLLPVQFQHSHLPVRVEHQLAVYQIVHYAQAVFSCAVAVPLHQVLHQVVLLLPQAVVLVPVEFYHVTVVLQLVQLQDMLPTVCLGLLPAMTTAAMVQTLNLLFVVLLLLHLQVQHHLHPVQVVVLVLVESYHATVVTQLVQLRAMLLTVCPVLLHAMTAMAMVQILNLLFVHNHLLLQAVLLVDLLPHPALVVALALVESCHVTAVIQPAQLQDLLLTVCPVLLHAMTAMAMVLPLNLLFVDNLLLPHLAALLLVAVLQV